MLSRNTVEDQKVYMKYICDEDAGLGLDRTVLKVYLGEYRDGTRMYEFSILGSSLPILLNNLTSKERVTRELGAFCNRHNIQHLSDNIRDFVISTAFNQ
jgi:hypothetical protein